MNKKKSKEDKAETNKVDSKQDVNKEIQDVIRDIIAQEEVEAAREIRIDEAKAEVSIAT